MIVSGIAHGIYWNLYDHKLHNHSQVYHKHPVLFQSIDYFIDYFCESFRHPCPISSIIVAGGERGGGLL